MYRLINFYVGLLPFPFRGWKYFFRWMKFWGVDKREYKKRLSNGLYITVTPSEHIQQHIFWYGFYERQVSLLLSRICSETSVFLDIGANIGYFTLTAAKKCKSGQVFAFEPVSLLFKKLKNNILKNNLHNVQAIQHAVGEVQGSIKMYLSAEDNMGMSSRHAPENFSGVTEDVEMISIDEWAMEIKADYVDIVKIDIEGGEFLALQGMRQTLINCRPFLIIEISEETMAPFGFASKIIFEFLGTLGYESFKINNDGRLVKLNDAQVNNENLAFVHSSRLPEYSAIILSER